jgi:hypothetical protein
MALVIITVIVLAVLAGALISRRVSVHRRHALADQHEARARARQHSLN